ncbi:MAG: aminoacetone oxidase family FAD-binding enzyme, partial [Verrucomicrobiales bacterium]|nr:aminoacetone oxidase family FAD-binding enzyme [Verrucomicrobiales bacterium]
ASVTILEKSSAFLTKVRISGGGRCNVTHALFEPRQFVHRYPRGAKALIGAFQSFSARHTVEWFQQRGVLLKTEKDGRMFPATDSSQTVIDCLMEEAKKLRIQLACNREVKEISRTGGQFSIQLSDGTFLPPFSRVLLGTGGCRTLSLGHLPVSLGHTLEDPVPSLFTFHVDSPWVKSLSGVAIEAEVQVPATGLKESGPVLFTHWGFSGPAILKLSAWGAREFHRLNYTFPLLINWAPKFHLEQIAQVFDQNRRSQPAKMITNCPSFGIPSRLWEKLCLHSGLKEGLRWSELSRTSQHQLAQAISRSEFNVTGKSLNKDEFVTCGGVRLSEVDFKTMESKICPGLFLAGELLDIDGITGGFNFQAAWTTGWLAGTAMAK